MLVNAEAAPANGPLEAFFERHCYDCHSGAKPEAGLDLAMLPRNFSDPAALRRLVLLHDRIAKGEMPPAEVERPSAADVAAVTTWLDAELHAADAARIEKSGRARMRRMTRSEFENTARDLLALDRLEVEGPLNESWPPESHRRLFGDLPIVAWPQETKATPPARDTIRQTPLCLGR